LESLAELVKEELRERYALAQRPTAREYFERYPRLCDESNFAVSLIYEEFCLLEESGANPDPEEFSHRYLEWRDSLELQLRVDVELCELARRVSPAPAFPEPGDTFQGFLVDSILGWGGTSLVYLAHEEAMGGRAVALKISPDMGPEPRIFGCLDHPRIMPAFSVCRDPDRGLRGLCMPYRTGMPLDELARRSLPLKHSHGALAFWEILADQQWPRSPQSPTIDSPGWLGFPADGSFEDGIAWIVQAVAQAVSHIHACGIIHCDIKPSNVYVAIRDGPLLFDFGFARSLRALDALPGGTLAYMAPEQLQALLDPRRWSEVGPTVDVHALGMTLVELLLGEAPDIPSSAYPEFLAARELLHRRSRPGWPRRIAARVTPRPLAEILEHCLGPGTEAKCTDAGDLANSLGRFLVLSATSRSRSFRYNSW
jgi:serine/threonine protein kinase